MKSLLFNGSINDEEYYISINDANKSIWYKYEIICSYNNQNNNILWAKDMILIPKYLKSKLYLEKYKTKKDIVSYIHKKCNYIDIIEHNNNNMSIFLGLTKIIKK
jgi:hypothetical protein